MDCYEFTPQELKLVENQSVNGDSKLPSWPNEELRDLRGKIKRHYIAEQSNTCAYCKIENLSTNGNVWHTDHIICRHEEPKYTYTPLNLCASCIDCNTAKGSRPVTKKGYSAYKSFPNKSANYLIVHPHFDKYEDHIETLVPGLTYRYMTSKGRNTIEICGLLRYCQAGGRKQVDLSLKAVLMMAADNQSKEVLQLVSEQINKKLLK
ncbi:HNH endonuclease [Pseudoalteromonas sp. MIP2626]|uniref:HNH endonuclease n=1 Tax=Pseudoalteromonas sp. MIP2626 TaxID=2705464 RepID=UPI001C53F175|nr:HNH endonuclease [Pseudoalteromonas sp. MIP2626]